MKYLPVIPLPAHDNIVKWYMDTTLKMIDDLAISHALVHADEAIMSKMQMISWLHEGRYDKIVMLMGVFI